MTILRALVMTAALTLAGQGAYAACASPVGEAGDIVYASNYSSFAFCNGTDWVSLAGWNNSSGGGASLLNELTDVDTTGAATGKILAYNGSTWVVSDTGVITTLAGLSDVDTSGAATGQILAYDGSGWVVSDSTSGGASAVSATGAIQFSADGAGAFGGDADNLYWDNANKRLGVGTQSPTANLQVTGSFIVSSTGQDTTPTIHATNGRLGIGISNPASALDIYVSNTVNRTHIGYGADFSNYFSTSLTGSQIFRRGGNVDLMVNGSGNVGIKTSTPNATLDVSGSISASAAIQVGSSSLSCSAGIPGAIRYNSGTLEYCNGSAWSALASSSAASAVSPTGAIQFSANGAGAFGGDADSLYWDNATKRLGIGTSVPGTTLSVSGGVVVSGTGSSYVYLNRSPGLYGSNIYMTNNVLRWQAGVGASVESGSNAGSDFSIWRYDDSGAFLANAFTILRASGYTGIGTSAPNALLNLEASNTTAWPATTATAFSGAYSYIPYPHEMSLENTATATPGSFSGIYMLAGANTPGSMMGTARIGAIYEGDYSAAIGFATRSSATGSVMYERMRIASDGKVGIGTVSPNTALSIVGKGTGGYQAIELMNNVVSGTATGAVITGGRKDKGTLPFAAFGTWDSGTARTTYLGGGGWSIPEATEVRIYTSALNETVSGGAERMRVTSAGNVGVSTSSPLAKLDVNGTISASDAIQVGGSSLTCGAGIPGAMKYATNKLYFCNGSAWTELAASTGGGSIAGGTGDIQFNSGGSFAADTGQLFWDATNNRLGLGTSLPSNTLHVMGDVDIGGSDVRVLRFRNLANSDHASLGIYNGGLALSGSSTATTSGYQHLFINNSGLVGIGMVTPSYNLDVSGTANFTTNTNTKITLGEITAMPNLPSFSSGQGAIGFSRESDGIANIGGIGLINNTDLLLGTYSDVVIGAGATGVFTSSYERMRITGAGNVGIGTSSPPAPLTISSTNNAKIRMERALFDTYEFRQSTGTGLTLANATDNRNEMFFDGAGNVGIGTVAPSQALDVSGSVNIAGSGSSDKLTFDNDFSAITTTPNKVVLHSGGYGFGVSGGLLNIQTAPTYDIGFYSGTSMMMLMDGTNGNIGISKTTAPLAKLDVVGTISASDAIQVGGSSLTCGAGIPGAMKYATNKLYFCNGTSWTELAASSGGSPVDGAGAANHIAYWSDADTLAYDNGQLYWDAAANRLGISTTTPARTLDVNGKAVVRDTLYIDRTGASGAATLSMTNSAGDNWLVVNDSSGNWAVSGDDFNDPLVLEQATPSNRLYATTAGNVGISTSTPAYTLDVNGSARVVNQLGVGTAPSAAYGIYSNMTHTNATGYAAFNYETKNATANGTYYNIGTSSVLKPYISSGITDSGYAMGAQASTLRDQAADAGVLNTLYGMNISFGHYTATASTRSTNTMYGLIISPYQQNGTISNSYTLFLNTPTAGGTVTGNNYALYQSSAAQINYFAGEVGVGVSSLAGGANLRVGGRLHMAGGTSNTITWGTTGVAAPGAGSSGMKLQLYGATPNVMAATDYAIGIESSTMWFNSGSAYKWYAGSAQKMSLDASGNLTAASYLYSSDKRLKENIVPLDGGLAKLAAIEPVTFRYISDTTHRERLGVIAQEVEAVYPQAVYTDDKGFKAVDYPALVPVLIDAVKELKAENDALAKRLDALEAKMAQ